MGLFDWFKKKKQEEASSSIIRIRLSGDEAVDNANAFTKMGIHTEEERQNILQEYTWHYLADLDGNMECTMQLVQTTAVEAAKPFTDSRDLYEERTGKKYIRKPERQDTDEEMLVDVSGARDINVATCKEAGFTPAGSLPVYKEAALRPAVEIACRLHAIKALVLWVVVPEADLPAETLQQYIDRNGLSDWLTEHEKDTLQQERGNADALNAIGWKFENAWPLAWFFGYAEPDITGAMMTGDQMREILTNYTCSLEETVADWTATRQTPSEETVIAWEDLFYCLHNAARSAQLGEDTVPPSFDPVLNGGVIHERRHAFTWMVSPGKEWEETDLST